jgi:hypothetical protein
MGRRRREDVGTVATNAADAAAGQELRKVAEAGGDWLAVCQSYLRARVEPEFAENTTLHLEHARMQGQIHPRRRPTLRVVRPSGPVLQPALFDVEGAA